MHALLAVTSFTLSSGRNGLRGVVLCVKGVSFARADPADDGGPGPDEREGGRRATAWKADSAKAP
jgi:hypothetical protein